MFGGCTGSFMKIGSMMSTPASQQESPGIDPHTACPHPVWRLHVLPYATEGSFWALHLQCMQINACVYEAVTRDFPYGRKCVLGNAFFLNIFYSVVL